MEKIDKLDRQILEIISQNARIPFKDVAAECGVSRAAIHQRVQRLIDMGVIVHYTPVFDEETGEELTVDDEENAEDADESDELDESSDEE